MWYHKDQNGDHFSNIQQLLAHESQYIVQQYFDPSTLYLQFVENADDIMQFVLQKIIITVFV